MKALVLVLLVACMNPKPPVYHPEIVSLVDTDSDKAIQVVSDERMREHEPRQVPTSAVAAALIASGMFLDDDAQKLAEPIARQLPMLMPEEALRIVAWAEDAPRYYFVLIHNGRLQIIYYAGSTQKDSYSAALPTDAVAIAAPIRETLPPQDGATEPPRSDAGPATTTPTHVAATRGNRKRTPLALQPINEAEARRKIHELDEAVAAGLLSHSEHKSRRKEILARL